MVAISDMVFLAAVTVAAGVFDIRKLKKDGAKKEIAVWCALCALVFAAALMYLETPARRSVMNLLLGVLEKLK